MHVEMWQTMLDATQTDLATKKKVYREKETSVADIIKRLAMKEV
jgi:hypothetical protein